MNNDNKQKTAMGDDKTGQKTGQVAPLCMHTPYQPKTGQPCHCKPGIQRDNCPDCEGTGMRIDFAAIRARRTESQHTPGPWKALGLFMDLTPSVGAMGRQGSFDICPEVNSGIYGSIEESQANARLIAAAPELLEACKAMLEGFDPKKDEILFEMMGPCGAEAEQKRIAARAAIAKAEGK